MILLAVRIRMLMIMMLLPQKKTHIYVDNLDDDEFLILTYNRNLGFIK